MLFSQLCHIPNHILYQLILHLKCNNVKLTPTKIQQLLKFISETLIYTVLITDIFFEVIILMKMGFKF